MTVNTTKASPSMGEGRAGRRRCDRASRAGRLRRIVEDLAVNAHKTGRDGRLGLGAAREKMAFDVAPCRKYGHSSDHALSRVAGAAERREDLGDDAFGV